MAEGCEQTETLDQSRDQSKPGREAQQFRPGERSVQRLSCSLGVRVVHGNWQCRLKMELRPIQAIRKETVCRGGEAAQSKADVTCPSRFRNSSCLDSSPLNPMTSM